MGKLTNLNPPAPIADSDIPTAIARDAEYIAADKAHVDAVDPHPQYLTQLEGDAIYLRGRTLVQTINPPVIGPGELYKVYYILTGTKPGDMAFISPVNVNTYTAALWPFVFDAIVEQVDTVAVNIRNDFSSALDLGSFQFRLLVITF